MSPNRDRDRERRHGETKRREGQRTKDRPTLVSKETYTSVVSKETYNSVMIKM
jgi:hypothetical protein